MYSARSSLVNFLIFAAGPKIVLPSGLYWKAVACKWSKITSSGSPSTCISINAFSLEIEVSLEIEGPRFTLSSLNIQKIVQVWQIWISSRLQDQSLWALGSLHEDNDICVIRTLPGCNDNGNFNDKDTEHVYIWCWNKFGMCPVWVCMINTVIVWRWMFSPLAFLSEWLHAPSQ